MRLVALLGLVAANSASAFVIPSTQVVSAPAKASAMRTYAVRAVSCSAQHDVGKRGRRAASRMPCTAGPDLSYRRRRTSTTTTTTRTDPTPPDPPRPQNEPRQVTMASSEVKQKPHGGKLVDLMVEGAAAEAAVSRATETLELSDRQLCDVELIINGGFSPLTGFMVRWVVVVYRAYLLDGRCASQYPDVGLTDRPPVWFLPWSAHTPTERGGVQACGGEPPAAKRAAFWATRRL